MSAPDTPQAVLDAVHGGDAQAIIETAQAAAAPVILDPRNVYERVVPAGATAEVLDLEQFLPAPRRLRGTVAAQRVQDLVRYVERHDAEEFTTIWVDAAAYRVIAVLNDHGCALDAADWGDHRAELQLLLTDAWKHWTGKDGILMAQEDFAEHIDDGLIDIVEPDGAEMLEVAQSIQGTTTAEFKAAHRLASGAIGVQYVEQQTAAAGQRGELEIPERFVLGVAPFEGEDAYKIRARLRYRIRGGNLTIGYRLERPGDVLRDAVDGIAQRLADQFGINRVFVGVPR